MIGVAVHVSRRESSFHPLRGQTALYLSVIHGRSEVTRELLREMMKARSVARNINIFSVDHVSRSALS